MRCRPLPSTLPQLVRFADFEADLRAGQLRKKGARIRLQEQPFRLLAVLLESAGEVVTREELRGRLWPADTFVDFDHRLAAAVSKLRDALADSAENPRFVETIGRRGYRFMVPVESVDRCSGQWPTPKRRGAGGGSSERMTRRNGSSQNRSPHRTRRRNPRGSEGSCPPSPRPDFDCRGNSNYKVPYLTRRKRTQPADPRSLAILPLQNLKQDPEQRVSRILARRRCDYQARLCEFPDRQTLFRS